MTRNKDKPKIVLYGVGQFGQYIIRFSEQKGWPIVAALNRAGEKVSKDIGQLASLGKNLGVIVEDCDFANYDQLDADIAIVATTDRLATNLPAYERLMNAGLNVICHGCESYYPYGIDTDLANRIDTLAKKNNVTFTGTGIWDASRIWLGLMVAGPCTEITSLFHKSTTDVSRTGKELMLITGVGMPQNEYQEKIASQPSMISGLYKTIPQHVLAALGYSVITVSERREPIVFNKPIYSELLGCELKAGTVIGTRIIADAKTKEGVTALMHHEGRLFWQGEKEQTMWSVEGTPSSRIFLERDDTAHFTASALFNRIIDVISAPAGIQLISQLGPMKHTAMLED